MTARTGSVEGVTELQQALADDAAFEAWYRRTLPRVYSYLLSRCANDVALAEELSQETFVAAIDQRARFDGRADLVTWLCGIARHKLADHFRRLEREERRMDRVVVREIEIGPGPDHWSAVDDREAIARALDTLPATQRAVVIFVDMDDLPVRQAARLVGKSF